MKTSSHHLIAGLCLALGLWCIVLGSNNRPGVLTPASASELEVIEAVWRHQESKGRDSARERLTARKHGDGWRVISWQNSPQDQVGAGEGFTPAFTMYEVGADGEVIQETPGL